MSQNDDTSIVMYSDYVCPFCYLGKASLEEFRSTTTNTPEVSWHPFDLRGYKRNPDGTINDSVDDGKDDAYFSQVRENVARLQDEYEVEMSLTIAGDIDSWDAQKATLYVQQNYDRSVFEAFHDAVYEALWVGEQDISDSAVLADIAESLDIPGEEIREALQDDNLEHELEAMFEAAKQEGVTGIPTFVYKEYAARGAVPPDHLDRLVNG